MKLRSLLPCLALWPWLALAANPAPADLGRWQQASACVAVLKADVTQLRDQVWAGQSGQQTQMVKLTEQGFAFIGTAYKQGLREPLADELLNQAEAATERLPAAERQALSQRCQAQGATLMREANPIERLLVSNRAKARVEKLLQR